MVNSQPTLSACIRDLKCMKTPKGQSFSNSSGGANGCHVAPRVARSIPGHVYRDGRTPRCIQNKLISALLSLVEPRQLRFILALTLAPFTVIIANQGRNGAIAIPKHNNGHSILDIFCTGAIIRPVKKSCQVVFRTALCRHPAPWPSSTQKSWFSTSG